MRAFKIYLVFALFISQFLFAQLNNFTFNVTPTHETCTANGSLSFVTTNLQAGSTIVYAIYLLPNTTTPIAITSANNYGGLTAGNYRVIATQSLGGNAASKQQDVVIQNQIQILDYQVSSERVICGNDGKIIITTTSGTAVSYEIFAGPVIRPLQSSNIFSNLPVGMYQIRVYNSCGEGVVKTFTLVNLDPTLQLSASSPQLSGCNQALLGVNISFVNPTIGVIKYPLQITATVTTNAGVTTTFSQTLTNDTFYGFSIPYTLAQTYSYQYTVVDGCGASYSISGTFVLNFSATHSLSPVDCTHKKIIFNSISALQLTSAPSTYPNPLPQNLTPQISSNSFTSAPLSAGVYVFQVTDVCGNQESVSITIEAQDNNQPYHILYNRTCATGSVIIYNVSEAVLVNAPATFTGGSLPLNYTSVINSGNLLSIQNLPIGTYQFSLVNTCGVSSTLVVTITAMTVSPTVSILGSCDIGFDTLKISGAMVSLQLISAPSAYTGVVPFDFSSALISNGSNSVFTLNNLPIGTYVFTSYNACNTLSTTTVNIAGYQENTVINVIPHCGSFDLNLQHTSTNTSSLNTFWLQKYYPNSNTWGHPTTGVVYIAGSTPTNTNSLAITNNFLNLNLQFSGSFRIVKSQATYGLNNTAPFCYKVIKEFIFDNQPKINSITSVSCGSNLEVYVNATGMPTLTYKITQQNGQPFVVDNGTSNVFSGLTAGIYNFQIIDGCGNVLNSLYEIVTTDPMVITPNGFCNGQPASLSVPNYPFLTYKWWKGTNNTTILSTSNVVNFNSFNSTTDNGDYHVEVIYPTNVSSCLNTTLSYTININNPLPNAGADATVSYCGNQGFINLPSLIVGNYTAGGTWQELTTSGMLSGSVWDSNNVLPGTYQFKYTVAGVCSTFDYSIITITIKSIPNTPTILGNLNLCEGDVLNLTTSYLPNVTYHWQGPNGFTSSLQNINIDNVSILNQGVYTLYLDKQGCVSPSVSVNVSVYTVPQCVVEQGCQENVYLLQAFPVNNSYNPADVNYSWTGPSGFSSTLNPVDITKKEVGVYTLTITNNQGCTTTKTVDVVATHCQIPLGISPNEDGKNDTFNLIGFNVKYIKIYSRYGVTVYEKEGYLNEWHGQDFKDRLLPAGTYYYYLEFADNKEAKTGWVYVNRED